MKIMIYDSGLGLIPFLKSIIKKQKFHEYYLYMDDDVFPLGNKDKDFIVSHLKFILNYANKNFDVIILACNTISSFLSYLDLSKYKIKIYSIFEYNTKHIDEETTFLGTKGTLSNLKIENKIDCSILPFLIETNDMKNIVSFINNLSINTKKAILGCTHFKLIDFIFKDLHKNIEFVSYEDELIENLSPGVSLSIKGNEKARRYLKEYLKLSNKILC